VSVSSAVERYIELGLRLGRHIDGFVDAYYGPPAVADQVGAEPVTAPARLADDARQLVADVDAGVDPEMDAHRRAWLRAQVVGLHTTARKLAGETIGYSDEVEWSYGARPRRVDEDELDAAHRALDTVLPGSGPLAERFVEWREAHAIPPDKLEPAIHSLAEDLRERTQLLFGLPDGEHIEFELVTAKPWAGFNYYLGDLRSRVAVNIDLPVLSTTLPHLVAHEAYPGHHTEHTRKEMRLVRQRQHVEETIFLVGTPQCLMSEGLADLGLEVVFGARPEQTVAEHLRPLGIRYDAEVIARVAPAVEAMGGVRGNAALMLHEDGADVDDVVAYLERWALLSPERALKSVEFITDPTWRAYGFCYIEGFKLCRQFVAGDPKRFERLITEQLIPADLAA